MPLRLYSASTPTVSTYTYGVYSLASGVVKTGLPNEVVPGSEPRGYRARTRRHIFRRNVLSAPATKRASRRRNLRTGLSSSSIRACTRAVTTATMRSGVVAAP